MALRERKTEGKWGRQKKEEGSAATHYTHFLYGRTSLSFDGVHKGY